LPPAANCCADPPGRLEWRAELAEAELGRVKPGDRIELTTRDGKTVIGQVRGQPRRGRAPAPAPCRPAGSAGPHPAPTCKGRIDTGVGQGLTVPAATVVQRDGHPNVFTVDAAASPAACASAPAASPMASRSAGRAEGGDAVVEQGAGFLGDGDSVRIVEATATPATTP
jgi:hypothetical protein